MADVYELAKFAFPPIIASTMVVMLVFVFYSLFHRRYQLSLICGILFLISFVLTFYGPLGTRIASKLQRKQTPTFYALDEQRVTREYKPPAEEQTELYREIKIPKRIY